MYPQTLIGAFADHAAWLMLAPHLLGTSMQSRVRSEARNKAALSCSQRPMTSFCRHSTDDVLKLVDKALPTQHQPFANMFVSIDMNMDVGVSLCV